MRRRASGAEAFATYYRTLYGERWPALQRAFEQEPHYVAIEHPGCDAYYLDEASKLAAETLPVEPSMRVVDLCAAPGGKTLVLAGRLNGTGILVANDRSRSRRERLKRVLTTHLPARLRNPITVTGHDATLWSQHETDAYDAVLLDVPCSAERHLISRPKELARWTASRTKRLSIQSYAMLASALDIIRIGGHILYSTCTLSPKENDEVILKLCRKRDGRVEVLHPSLTIGEKTATGRMVLPDRDDGRGPLFFALLKRIK